MCIWLCRIFHICWVRGGVPKEWQEAVVLPVYKGNGNKRDCGNFRGIIMFNIIGKVYGRILIERGLTEGLVGEEQSGFRKGRGCIDQIFAIKCLCEKFREKGRDVYIAFMDLEKAYDRVDREALWVILSKYGIRGKLLDAVKGFYFDSRACARVDGVSGEMFEVKVGLRQGCVMSPWLFNLYMDSVVREVKRECGEDDLDLKRINGGGLWRVNVLLFSDDTVLLGESKESLQRLVTVFNRICMKKKLSVNREKSKVMRVGKMGYRET